MAESPRAGQIDDRPRLTLGIKRTLFRGNDPASALADAAFEAVRTTSLESARHRCRYCGYESTPVPKKRATSLQVHHLDDDHANNEPANLLAVCSLDHAYHHIGCNAPSPGAPQGWANRLRLAYIPELSPQDTNTFQRAIGAALLDEQEHEIARELVNLLGTLALPVRDAWGSNKAPDFAACLDSLTSGEYEQSKDRLSALRVLFHPEILKTAGQQQLDDAPLLPVRSWPGLLEQSSSVSSGGTLDGHGHN